MKNEELLDQDAPRFLLLLNSPMHVRLPVDVTYAARTLMPRNAYASSATFSFWVASISMISSTRLW